jgi:HPt (histidine-containing phosphotransfer) domain-containing protein
MSDAEAIVVHVDQDLADLIPEFLDNRRGDVESIRGAVASDDYETVRVLGHSMKGSGGGFGFDDITEIGAALEQAAKRKDEMAIRDELEKLANYLARVEVV